MRIRHRVFVAALALLGGPLAAQDVIVRAAPRVNMPQSVDSNSPAYWRDGMLHWFGSHGGPWVSVGGNQFGGWETFEVTIESPTSWPKWLEAIWPDEDGTVWGWYHAEPGGLVANDTLTAPRIGAVVSTDGGRTFRDLGVVLEAGDPLDPNAQNGYFAGGHGDFSVILDRERQYFYFYFGNYGGSASSQGVCVARMAFADRFSPAGKVRKYYNGAWEEPGRAGRVTPIFPVTKHWQSRDPDAFWGPAVHWNTHLKCFVMLLNHAQGEPGWAQEGVYISYSFDLTRPEAWSTPRRIVDKSQFSGWYFFYPQVMGLGLDETDREAGRAARLYVGSRSKWELEFVVTTPVLQRAGPAEISVPAGAATTLAVSVTGTGPFTYQWHKDGVAIPQATGATFTLAATTTTDAGVYTVAVSNSAGTSTGSATTVAVTPASAAIPPPAPSDEEKETVPPPPVEAPRAEAFLSNLSVRSFIDPTQAALAVGFVVRADAPKPVIVRAVGPTLARFGVANALPDPRLEVFDSAAVSVAENDNWRATDAPAFAALGAFSLPEGSADSGLVVRAQPGAGTAVVASAAGGVALVEIYDPEATAAAKFINLSARARVGVGDEVLIGGFNVTGQGTKRVIVRAVGPQLAAYGVEHTLANPRLELYGHGGTLIAENDNWDAALGPAFAAAGAAPLPPGSADAALVAELEAGSTYTVIVRGEGNDTGQALLEIFEMP